MTYELIASHTLTAGAASVEFVDIPQTFDDLDLVISARTNSTSGDGFLPLLLRFNADGGANYSYRRVSAIGNTAGSSSGSGETSMSLFTVPGAHATSNTFGSYSAYVPNYTGSAQKSVSIVATTENNATLNFLGALASLWSGTSPVSSIQVSVDWDALVTNSSFYLYGISNS